jgi:hypothetical protein
MELAGLIFLIVVIIAAIYFVLKSKVPLRLLQIGSKSKKQASINDKAPKIDKAIKYEEKGEKAANVIHELRTLDIKRPKANIMVERILADRIEELKDELTMARDALSGVRTQLGDLEIKYAVLKGKYRSERIMEWIRNLAGVGMGIFGTLFFSNDPVQHGVGKLVTPFMIFLFIITFVFSLLRKEKD